MNFLIVLKSGLNQQLRILGKQLSIKDNENNYFRIHDNSRKQYLDSNGNVVKTGNLQGKQAKDYLQQQTHIRNLDK